VVQNEPRESEPGVEDSTLELLRRWRGGDRGALDQLLADVEPWLHREMRKAVGVDLRTEQDSLDLAHAAVVNFLASGPRFVPESAAQFRALLKRIALNEVFDQRRRQGRRGTRVQVDAVLESRSPLSGFGRSQGSSERARKRGSGRQWWRGARLGVRGRTQHEAEFSVGSTAETREGSEA